MQFGAAALNRVSCLCPGRGTVQRGGSQNAEQGEKEVPMKSSFCLISVASLLAAGTALQQGPLAPGSSPSPIEVALHPSRESFGVFHNRNHPGNRIGYRFHEHTPMIEGAVPRDASEAGIDAGQDARLAREYEGRPGVLKYALEVAGKEWIPQKWTFLLLPVEDGIEILLKVETRDLGMNSYYGVQQCFRMGGATNAAWRQEIARTPAFSEYDYWAELKSDGKPPASLTYVLRQGTWEALPAETETVGARTPLGVELDRRRTGGHLAAMPRVGPYNAVMLEPVDDGLITRVSRDRTWISGIYWERTSHVTDHHPADCVHSIVNIGGIPPHGTRVLRGKIYWFKGTADDLRRKWQSEFKTNPAARR